VENDGITIVGEDWQGKRLQTRFSLDDHALGHVRESGVHIHFKDGLESSLPPSSFVSTMRTVAVLTALPLLVFGFLLARWRRLRRRE
jgi:hypothetical protein